ncbi:MAG TPA: hypothetical protein VF581_04365 [Flavobacterium sp.]
MKGFRLFENNGYTQATSYNKVPFEIPFEVKKGEITYIGEFEFFENGNKAGSIIKVGDNFDRDIEALKVKAPAINWTKAVNKTVKSGTTGGGMIQF